jgi:acyl carrier protein
VSAIELELQAGDQVRARIREFITSAVSLPNLDDEADLFASGIVNSLFAVQLMTFIEKTFAIEVGMDDLDMENFKSVQATSDFVRRKRSG